MPKIEPYDAAAAQAIIDAATPGPWQNSVDMEVVALDGAPIARFVRNPYGQEMDMGEHNRRCVIAASDPITGWPAANARIIELEKEVIALRAALEQLSEDMKT